MKTLFILLFSIMIHDGYSQECFLVVKSGGGVTGMQTVYQIRPNGEVLKGSGRGEVMLVEKGFIRKSVARKYYRRTRKLVKASPAFDHPGNFSYSLATKEGEKESKMTWGAVEHPAPEQAKNLFKEITNLLTALTFTANTSK
jgi:hypothetical protein